MSRYEGNLLPFSGGKPSRQGNGATRSGQDDAMVLLADLLAQVRKPDKTVHLFNVGGGFVDLQSGRDGGVMA
jgi:hypothetical protein